MQNHMIALILALSPYPTLNHIFCLQIYFDLKMGLKWPKIRIFWNDWGCISADIKPNVKIFL